MHLMDLFKFTFYSDQLRSVAVIVASFSCFDAQISPVSVTFLQWNSLFAGDVQEATQLLASKEVRVNCLDEVVKQKLHLLMNMHLCLTMKGIANIYLFWQTILSKVKNKLSGLTNVFHILNLNLMYSILDEINISNSNSHIYRKC